MVFPVTTGLKGGAVGNVCKSLLKRGLIEEVAATDQNTVWRHDEERGPITLRATPLAYGTLGITEEPRTRRMASPRPHPLPSPPAAAAAPSRQTLIEMLAAPRAAPPSTRSSQPSSGNHTPRGAPFPARSRRSSASPSPPRKSTEEVGRTASLTAEPLGQQVDHAAVLLGGGYSS